ncbi:MAG: DNA-3-methyladenine glycosylase [Clostridia bacterium]|nr:DNA-3-methyladenine glycosylase [Clostridia bacterium]
MKVINDLNFFTVPTIMLAQNLVGKWIETNICGKTTRAQITETEAYLGITDTACHTFGGKHTPRTEPMWQIGGTIYIYLIYGMHLMLNIVSESAGKPEAVLIRAVAGANGPAKATKLLNITKNLNGQSIINNSQIKILDDGKKYFFTTAPRVGIAYASAKDQAAKLRFCLK